MAISDRRADPAERPAGTFALRVLAAAGLAVDAYVHADLAPAYGSGQQGLFLVAAGVAVAAALLVLAGDRPAAHLVAVLVAAGALAAVVTYRYVDPGSLGPLPDMYEPVWYPEKVVAAVAETVAASAAGLLLLADLRRSRGRRCLRRSRGRP